MSKQALHTISTEWLTVFREDYGGIRTYTHVCPVCRYFYKDKNEHGKQRCPNCNTEMIEEDSYGPQ